MHRVTKPQAVEAMISTTTCEAEPQEYCTSAAAKKRSAANYDVKPIFVAKQWLSVHTALLDIRGSAIFRDPATVAQISVAAAQYCKLDHDHTGWPIE